MLDPVNKLVDVCCTVKFSIHQGLEGSRAVGKKDPGRLVSSISYILIICNHVYNYTQHGPMHALTGAYPAGDTLNTFKNLRLANPSNCRPPLLVAPLFQEILNAVQKCPVLSAPQQST